jgi:CheY-like chemotaxis protein
LKFDVPRQNLAIVIVDDSSDLIRVYERFFEVVGLRIVAKFQSGKEALSQFSSDSENLASSVVLLDYNMPEMDGLEVAKKLKRLNPKQRIILSTGEDLSRLSLEKNLYDGMIRKPFTIGELVEAIQKVLSPIHPRGSRIFSDPKELEELLAEVISDSKEKMCMIRTGASISRGIRISGHRSSYVQARSKGLKVFMITEITKENMYCCRELMIKNGVQLRHLDNVVMNLFLWDDKHTAEIVTGSNPSHSLGQYVYSNLDQVVGNARLVFSSMWDNAIPAEQKMIALEATVHSSNEVRTIVGLDEIVKTRAEMVRNSQISVDTCSFPTWGKAMISRMKDECRDAISRGVKFRMIFDITLESIDLAKEYEELGMEVRSLPNLKGAFSVNEKEFMGVASIQGLRNEKEITNIYSNQPDFVAQHQSIFNVLWNFAVPASEKIKEIEKVREISSS